MPKIMKNGIEYGVGGIGSPVLFGSTSNLHARNQAITNNNININDYNWMSIIYYSGQSNYEGYSCYQNTVSIDILKAAYNDLDWKTSNDKEITVLSFGTTNIKLRVDSVYGTGGIADHTIKVDGGDSIPNTSFLEIYLF